MSKQHATGYTGHLCGGVAVVDIDGAHICAERTIEARTTLDLRAHEPTVTVSID
jgi:hypothetical protein